MDCVVLFFTSLPCKERQNREPIFERADERTRTADLISLRVCGQGLLSVAQACKPRILRRLSLLQIAPCYTVLRTRWYQSGINSVGLSTFIRRLSSTGLLPPSEDNH